MANQAPRTPGTPRPDRPGRLYRLKVDVNDPWTWAITPDMTCPVEDMPPMTDEECAAAARILDDLCIMHARHPTSQHPRHAAPHRRRRKRQPADTRDSTGDGSARYASGSTYDGAGEGSSDGTGMAP